MVIFNFHPIHQRLGTCINFKLLDDRNCDRNFEIESIFLTCERHKDRPTDRHTSRQEDTKTDKKCVCGYVCVRMCICLCLCACVSVYVCVREVENVSVPPPSDRDTRSLCP